MAKKRNRVPKTNRNLLALVITCIYEHHRFNSFRSGPTFTKLRELLLVVYSLDIPMNTLGTLLLTINRGLIYANGNELHLTPQGINYFYLHKRSIIQTKVIPQSKPTNSKEH
jgi:hypothetical protein